MNLKVVSAKIEVPSCMEIWKEQFRKKVVFKKEIKKKKRNGVRSMWSFMKGSAVLYSTMQVKHCTVQCGPNAVQYSVNTIPYSNIV